MSNALHSVMLHSPRQNKLLAALPPSDYARLLPDLELIHLDLGEILYEAGDQQRYAYFFTTGVVAKVYPLGATLSQEIAVVGNCGMVGMALVFGGESAPHRAVVQCAGHAYRLPIAVLKSEFTRAGALQRLLLRYAQALIAQMSQTVVCNRFHSVDQQLCRWLLLSLDRMPSDQLTLTEELIADMLGVRRGSPTAARGHLHSVGLGARSHIKIGSLDRPQLESRVCECYAVMRREHDRLLSYMLGSNPIPHESQLGGRTAQSS